ncbi:MAG: hypothetical protein E5W55_02070 [Mesorhizobium sp.]|nr:MAG: hypothetical protein E5W55_02070 [Mesorhizobium sp.]
MIDAPRYNCEYADREIDCQEAMEPGFQAIVDCMLEAGWERGEIMRSLRRLIAADNMAPNCSSSRTRNCTKCTWKPLASSSRRSRSSRSRSSRLRRRAFSAR